MHDFLFFIKRKDVMVFSIKSLEYALLLNALKSSVSIPYRRLYRFGQRYDIFWIPVNTTILFRVYCYLFIYIYIYICMYVCMCVCVYIIINLKVYHKTFPQFRTNYSWFQTLVLIKRKKKHNIKNKKLKSYHCILRK